MEAILEQPVTKEPQIGDVLFVHEGSFTNARNKAQKVLPSIEKLKEQYNKLGLPELTTATLHQLLRNGIASTKKAFEEMTKRDLAGFKSPIALQQAMKEVEDYLNPLQVSISEINKQIQALHNDFDYLFSFTDYEIKDGCAALVEKALKDHFTETINSETKLNAYKALINFAVCYNETLDVVKKAIATQVPVQLWDVFVERQPKGEFSFFDTVEVNIKAVASLK